MGEPDLDIKKQEHLEVVGQMSFNFQHACTQLTIGYNLVSVLTVLKLIITTTPNPGLILHDKCTCDYCMMGWTRRK